MLEYMINSAIGNWAALFLSIAWLALHGVLYSFFVAVLLINFSTPEDEKMPTQRSIWHHDAKKAKKDDSSAIMKQLKAEIGGTRSSSGEDDDLVEKLTNAYHPDHPHRSFYVFGCKNPVRLFCASIEQSPRFTQLFLLLVALSLMALTMETGLSTLYENCVVEYESCVAGSESGELVEGEDLGADIRARA